MKVMSGKHCSQLTYLYDMVSCFFSYCNIRIKSSMIFYQQYNVWFSVASLLLSSNYRHFSSMYVTLTYFAQYQQLLVNWRKIWVLLYCYKLWLWQKSLSGRENFHLNLRIFANSLQKPKNISATHSKYLLLTCYKYVFSLCNVI